MDVELLHQPRAMRLCRLHADAEQCCELFRRLFLADQFQNLSFADRQTVARQIRFRQEASTTIFEMPGSVRRK